jgi:S1-C subfamily serine protease
MWTTPNAMKKSSTVGVATVAVTAVLLSACSFTLGRSSAPSTSTASPAGVSVTSGSSGSGNAASADPVVRVVKVVEPAVVSITATSSHSNPFFGGSSTQQATGSGFIVSSDGVIFTNDHVIEGASKIEVTLPDGRSFEATVTNTDARHDFAVLKVDAAGLPTVTLGNSSKLQLGQSVVAIGYALGLDGGPSVTSGIISSLERTVQAQDANVAGGVRTYENVLQTSAAINPGNSGGPLVDLGGRVVGINTAGVGSADNIGFAISIDAAKSFIASAVAGS